MTSKREMLVESLMEDPVTPICGSVVSICFSMYSSWCACALSPNATIPFCRVNASTQQNSIRDANGGVDDLSNSHCRMIVWAPCKLTVLKKGPSYELCYGLSISYGGSSPLSTSRGLCTDHPPFRIEVSKSKKMIAPIIIASVLQAFVNKAELDGAWHDSRVLLAQRDTINITSISNNCACHR